jgi:signal transduction histidine kinase
LSDIRRLLILICIGLLSLNGLLAAEQIRVGIYENAPKVFTDDEGRASGIFVEILELIAEQEDWELEYIPGTWPEGLARLDSSEIDLMVDVAYSSDREERFSFHSIPVIPSWYQVYAREDSDIQTLLDLQDKTIVVLEQSVQQAAFEKIVQGFGLFYTLTTVTDYEDMFRMVSDGRADAAVASNYFGQMHAPLYGLKNTGVVFEPSDLFFAAPKGSDMSILDAIDSHLENMKADASSEYYQILKDWSSIDQRFRLPRWVFISLGILALGIAASWAWSITLRKKVAERTSQLSELNGLMEQKVIERTAELEQAMEQAKSADNLKSAFLASMSHELRTPLNSIIGFTGILMQEMAGPLNEEQKKQLSMVQKSSKHLLSLINDVLDISKIEAGQLELAQEPCSIEQAVENALRIISPLAAHKGLAIVSDVPKHERIITGDQRRMEQVVLNILQNAVKFTESGEIRVRLRHTGSQYILNVEDTGIGMAPENLNKLFRPFQQLDSGTARRYEGTGLGLSISKKIIELAGGTIGVESSPGRGSVFTVTIPEGNIYEG